MNEQLELRQACDCPMAKFETFYPKHPVVLKELFEQLDEALELGFDHYGIRLLYENLRWKKRLAGLPDPEEDYKLNDHYMAGYSRLMVAVRPEIDGLFRPRATKACPKCGRHWETTIREALTTTPREAPPEKPEADEAVRTTRPEDCSSFCILEAPHEGPCEEPF